MTPRSWVRKLFARPTTSPIRRAKPQTRLGFEALEDRTVPSTFTVLNSNDTGAGSLRDAVANANANIGADTIVFGDGSGTGGTNFLDGTPDTIVLTSGVITFAGDTNLTTVTGTGANLLTISGGNTQGVWWLNASTAASISGMTVTQGKSGVGAVYNAGTLTMSNSSITSSTSTAEGGGVFNDGSLTMNNVTISGSFAATKGGGLANSSTGTATLTNCIVTGNTVTGSSGGGGGISNLGSLTLTGCTVSGNSVTGSFSSSGGINHQGGTATLIATDTTISGNTATHFGGGLSANGTATLTNCTISGNTATVGGGGINSYTANLTMVNCTVSGNQTGASGQGGGIFLSFGSLSLTNLTISGNTANSGGGIYHTAAGVLTVGNTIVSANTATTGPDVVGAINTDNGYNLFGAALSGTTFGTGNVFTDTPGLGALANYGGPTQTMALLGGSPAINAGNNALIPGGVTTDQRGFARIYGGTVDIGAFEVNGVTVTNLTDVVNGTTTSVTALLASPGADGISLREAIQAVNNTTGVDFIDFFGGLFGTPQTITLTGGQLTFTDAATTTITGPGAALLSVSGNNASGVFNISSGASAAISGLRVTGGKAVQGGGIINSGNVTLSAITVSGNTAAGGGFGGGGIANYGTLTLTNSTISGNTAPNQGGGGITNAYSGVATLTNVTVSGNTSGSGGGVASDGGNPGGVGLSLTMTNCTISGNTATQFGGGGVFVIRGGTITLTNCTVSGNTSTAPQSQYSTGGVVHAFASTVRLANTIVAGNTGSVAPGADTAGVLTSLGNNLIGNRGTTTGWLASDLTGTTASPLNPQLGALANNGGPTQTMALLFNSPAIEAGNVANAPATDQTGTLRTGNTDIGAVEYRFKVTTTADSGTGSLRQAITNANAVAGTDTVLFRIPGAGVRTISTLSGLPAVTGPIVIDGTTQPGFGGTPLIQISGSGAGNVSGLTLDTGSGGSTVKGLIVSNFSTAGSAGIWLNSPNNTIQGNWIGLNSTGTAAAGNYNGIELSSGNLIGTNGDGVNDTAERNVIGGNLNYGIDMNGANNNRIAGNYIGTTAAGDTALVNAFSNVATFFSTGNIIGTDGSNDAFNANERNVISGGIILQNANVLAGNYIGINAAGTAALTAAGALGVQVSGTTGSRVGTNADGIADAEERNVISGINGPAVLVTQVGAVVAGNFIGTNAAGTSAVANQRGVELTTSATGVRIGTNADGVNDAAEGNLISGNSVAGVRIGSTSTGNVVAGNTIGLNAAGTAALPNATGILIDGGSSNNTIGGAAAGAGNRVSGNTGAGIRIDGATTVGNTLRQNAVYGNAGGQISLTNGGNRNQPGPVLTGVLGGSSTRVLGTLAGGVANTAYLIELFSATAPGEARQSLGTGTFATNAFGSANFDVSVAGVVPFGSQVTATATRVGTGDTSSLDAGQPAAGAIISGIPLALAEGTPVTLTAFTAADPGGGQALAYNWTVTKNGSPFAAAAEASITFTPDDEGIYAVTLLVTNSTGTSAVVGPITLTATNARPAPQIFGAPSSAQAGTPISLHGVGNDPGTADAVLYSWQVRDTNATGAVLFSGSGPDFAFTPTAGGLYYVALTANDQDGGVTTTAQVIIVSGGAALATITAPAITDEGTPVRVTAAVGSLILTDTLQYQWTVKKAGVPYPFTRADEGVITFTPNDNALYTIGLTVTSGGTAYTATPAVVDVRNVNPDAAIVGVPATAPAGVPVTVTGVAADRGTADVHTYQWSVVGPAGSPAVPGGTGSTFTFTPPVAGDYVLKLTVRDDDGGSTTVARGVRVTATGLTVAITGAPLTGPEGTAIPLNSTITSPGTATFRYEWAVTRDGVPFGGLSSAGFIAATSFPFTLTPTDNGRYVVTLTVTASDGRVGSATKTITITNVAPSASISGGTGTLLEGSPITLTAAATDPASEDVLRYEWRVNGNLQPNGADPRTFVFTPPDNGSFVIGLTVFDDDGGSVATSKTLTVQNVAPTAKIVGDPTTTATSVGLVAAVSDPGILDTFTYAWSVTGGTPIGTTTAATFRYTPTAGTVTVTLTVTDDDGGTVTRTTRSVVLTPNNDTLTILAPGTGVDQILVQGLAGNDVITTDSGVLVPVVIDAGDGDDQIGGGGQNDLLIAGLGNNTLSGGFGNDTLRGGGNDDLSGGGGNDTYEVHFSTVRLTETGTGIDTIDLTAAQQGVTFNLSVQDGTAQPVFAGSSLAITGSFEVLKGSTYGDNLTTSTSNTTVFGGLGDDSLTASAGASVTVFGGDGNDTLAVTGGTQVTVFGDGGDDSLAVAGGASVTVFGGDGNDSLAVTGGTDVTVFGGDGNDTLSVGGAAGAVTVFGGDGTDNISINGATGIAVVGSGGQVVGGQITLFGSAGDDDSIAVAAGANITVFGGDGNDSLSVAGGTNVTVFGGDGSDTLSVGGGAAQVTVFGGDGDDSLAVAGGAAQVTVFGGEGNDTLAVGGAAGQVTVFGGDGNDSLAVTGGTDVTVFGGEGNDTLSVTAGTQVTVFGDGGDDTLAVGGAAGQVTVFGGDGNDSLAVTGGTDVTVFGGDGNDTLAVGGGAQVTVFGDGGDDTLAVAGGTHVTVFGGDGNDSLAVAAGTDVTVFGGEGNDSLAVTGGTDVTVFGGDGNDTLAVTGGTDVTVFGGDGNDSLAVAGGANVTVFGGDGNDTLSVGSGAAQVTVFGGDGNDSLAVSGGTNVTVFGDGGDDTLAVTGGTNVTVFGADGNDSLAVSGGTNVTVFGGDGNDTLAVTNGAQVTVFGGDGNDSLAVSGGTNVTVFGGDGNDSLAVSGGTHVTVFGGDGNDTLAATGGTDVTVFGGEGNDTLTVGGGVAQVTVFGGEGDDSLAVTGGTHVTVFGGDGNDTLAVGGGVDVTVFGGDGNDSLAVSGGTDVTVFGDGGDDTLAVTGGSHVTVFGADGNDSLTVGGGVDVTVFGGRGNDAFGVTGGTGVKLYGEVGDDVLTAAGGLNLTVSGGSGNDTLTAAGGTGVVLLGDTGTDSLAAAGGTGVTLSGGTGDDTLAAAQAAGVYLFGDDGNDTYRFAAGGVQSVRVKEILILAVNDFEATAAGGVNLVKGGDAESRGSDTLDLSAYTGAAFNLSVFGSEADALVGAQSVAAGFTLTIFGTFENVIGTAGNDTLVGNGVSNRLVGGGGNDVIDGQGGDDTIEGGAGNDALAGGTGNDTYVFAGSNLGTDTLAEAANADSDTLDFAQFASALSLNLGSTAAQAFGANLTLTLSNGTGVENVTGTAFEDSITGNGRDNLFEGGAGNDTLAGGAGDDTYVFHGVQLGADTVVEAAGADSDTLDFAEFDAPLILDLAVTTPQALGGPGQSLTLSDGAGVENVVGTVYADTLRGNARDNALYGGGGADFLDGRDGNDTLQGDFTQVVLLDFDSATSISSGDHVYTAAERADIIARLQTVFAPFNYLFTTDPAQAAALTAHSGRGFVTIVYNDGAGGGIGGEANELDPGNRTHADRGTVDVNTLLGGAGQPANTSANVVGLTATITAHELGHMAGLLHADAFGPVGTGIYAGVAPTRFLPAYTGPAGATETPHHVMASPLSLGTTLFDAAGPTAFGAREAIKLAFNETGVVRAEQATAPGGHQSFATAEALGVLPGLAVPNTLLPGDRDYGKTFDVSALSVVGNIQLAGGRSEDDVYSFTGKMGDVMNLAVVSGVINPSRGNPIDGVLKLYGSNGQLLAINDDSPESTDPTILDFTLPADGVYYVVVDTYAAALDVDVGRYELFLYRFATTTGTPAVNLGDTVVGGAGSDTVIGSAADDIFRATGSVSGDLDVYSGKAGFDALDLTGYPVLSYTQTGVELVVGANQAPTLAVVPPVSVSQGAAVTITPVATDPDAVDRLTFTLAPTGSDVFPAGATVDPRTGVVTWVAGRPGTYAALLTVTDAAGAAVSRVISIQVANVAPTVSAGGSATLAEAGTLSRTGSFADAGADPWTATVNYGDGTGVQPLALNPDKSFALTHTYADNGSYPVTVVVNDGSVSSSPGSFTVTVTDVAPTATLSNAGPVNEGGSATVSFANPSDPSSADTTAGFRYSFALSAGALAGTYAAANAAASQSFPFPASGTYTVYGRVFDKDNGYTDFTTTVVVANVAPTATASVAPGTVVNQGTPLSFTGTATDPGNDVASTVWTVVSSNGQVVNGGTGTAFAFTPSAAGTYTVLFKATDADGAVGVATLQITVTNNVAPVAGAITAPLDPLAVGTAVSASAPFTDANPTDTHTAVWNWGDGTTSAGTITEANGSGTVTGSHTYTAAGVYTVTLTVTDNSGSSHQVVYQYVVMYDPSAGYVTGGGWIMSPAGAYTPNPALTGKANFGFVSKYLNGNTVPTGNTEFQFKAGDFNFKSTSYEWMVISGAKARYKGVGTVNGVAGYGFELTAWDGQANGGGGVDKFRIKIWNGNPGNVIYDNQLGDADGTDPTTALGGGSIVIHR